MTNEILQDKIDFLLKELASGVNSHIVVLYANEEGKLAVLTTIEKEEVVSEFILESAKIIGNIKK